MDKDSILRAIRRKCLDCMGNGAGARKLVEQCASTDCPLHEFRNGEDRTKRSCGIQQENGQIALFEISA